MPLFIKIAIFSFFSYLGLFSLDFLYERKVKNIYIEKPSYLITCTDKTFDYVVGGSSRVHNNFNTPLFDSLSGLNGFNIGYGGSALAQNYLTLYLFLKNGNKTKVYLQQVEDNFLMDPKVAFSYPFQDYFFMPYIGNEQVDECYKNNTPSIKFYMWKYIPFLKYAEFNNYYSLGKIVKPTVTDLNMLNQKGYSKLETTHVKGFPAAVYQNTNNAVSVDESNIFYLDKMRDLCKKNGISFIIYTSPSFQKSYLAGKNEKLHSALINYVTDNQIKYFNFLLDNRYQSDSLFYDETHLNAIGTDIFTAQLSDSLKPILK